MIDVDKMVVQETHDYKQAKSILSDVFGKWQTTFTPMPIYSPSDMRFEVAGKRKYNVEVKSKNQPEYYTSIPLTVRKYNNLVRDTKADEKLVYMVMTQQNKYYVFDLSALNVTRDCKIKPWRIKKVEYSEDCEYEVVNTIFIPCDKAVTSGVITPKHLADANC